MSFQEDRKRKIDSDSDEDAPIEEQPKSILKTPHLDLNKSDKKKVKLDNAVNHSFQAKTPSTPHPGKKTAKPESSTPKGTKPISFDGEEDSDEDYSSENDSGENDLVENDSGENDSGENDSGEEDLSGWEEKEDDDPDEMNFATSEKNTEEKPKIDVTTLREASKSLDNLAKSMTSFMQTGLPAIRNALRRLDN